MIIDIITLFPNMFDGFLNESIIKRACERDFVQIRIHNLRDYSLYTHKQVDDTPYGGGSGMVLMCDPIFRAVEALKTENTLIILMSPQGITYNQKTAYDFVKKEHMILICGHYEGFDERILSIVDLEVSIGDYILTGGEIPSMVITDSIVRLIDGVIDEESHKNDSTYTKPRVYRDMEVPEILLSGHHKNIEHWRKQEQIKKTKEKRPDLLEG